VNTDFFIDNHSSSMVLDIVMDFVDFVLDVVISVLHMAVSLLSMMWDELDLPALLEPFTNYARMVQEIILGFSALLTAVLNLVLCVYGAVCYTLLRRLWPGGSAWPTWPQLVAPYHYRFCAALGYVSLAIVTSAVFYGAWMFWRAFRGGFDGPATPVPPLECIDFVT
jgi:hypothetical protein